MCFQGFHKERPIVPTSLAKVFSTSNNLKFSIWQGMGFQPSKLTNRDFKKIPPWLDFPWLIHKLDSHCLCAYRVTKLFYYRCGISESVGPNLQAAKALYNLFCVFEFSIHTTCCWVHLTEVKSLSDSECARCMKHNIFLRNEFVIFPLHFLQDTLRCLANSTLGTIFILLFYKVRPC